MSKQRSFNLETIDDLGSSDFNYFYDNVLGSKHFIVFVHAPWCHHCVDFKPKVEAAHTVATKKHNEHILVKISDEPFRHLTESHADTPLGKLLNANVRGFPTLAHVTPSPQDIKMFSGDRDDNTLLEMFLQQTVKDREPKAKKVVKPKPTVKAPIKSETAKPKTAVKAPKSDTVTKKVTKPKSIVKAPKTEKKTKVSTPKSKPKSKPKPKAKTI